MFICAGESFAVQSGADFLKYGIGAKNSAMGEVSLTGSGNITSSYWNPAISAMSKNNHIAAAYAQTMEDEYLAYIGAGTPFGKWFAGINATLEIIESMHATNGNGEYNHRERAFSLVSARNFLDNYYAGASLKLIRRLEDYPGGSDRDHCWAVDLGLVAEFPAAGGLTAGVSLLNWGQELGKYGKLPRTLRVSGSFETGEFIFAADVSRVLEANLRLSGGVEYRMSEEFFLRTGYNSQEGEIDGITYGIGIESGNFQVDWASMPGGELMDGGRENRVSVIVDF